MCVYTNQMILLINLWLIFVPNINIGPYLYLCMLCMRLEWKDMWRHIPEGIPRVEVGRLEITKLCGSDLLHCPACSQEMHAISVDGNCKQYRFQNASGFVLPSYVLMFCSGYNYAFLKCMLVVFLV